MIIAKIQILCFRLLALSACILSAASMQDGAVHICVGQPQTFSCEVPKQGSALNRLEWRIEFEPSSSEADVSGVFTSADSEGHILRDSRPGVTFVFNLTSTGSSSLVSVMNLTVDDINATALINNATVNCGDEANRKILQIIEGPPPLQMNFTHDLMKFQWNPATMADHYIISISPPVSSNESESTIKTFNTTIHLQLQYNLDYNVSVMASNCAGNGTPSEISVRVGYCKLSMPKHGNINSMDKRDRSGEMEGSQVSFYCHDNRIEPMKATCMKNGSWNPDPHTYKCQEMDAASREHSSLKMAAEHVITVIIIAVIAVVLIVIISAVIVLTAYRKRSSQKRKLDHSNFYSDLPSSQLVNENQELGIYSLLQPEQQTVTKVQSTDQTAAAPVYADVGSTLSRNPNTKAYISPQLDDDRVQYADIKHHQQTTELHQKECGNSDTDAPAVDLDTLLIHLRSHVTPKWHQFGEAVGIPEEILKKYSDYPPEECIMEVFDYWLRSHSSTDKPTWRDVANVLMKMELQPLADKLMQNGPPVPVDMNTIPEHLLQPNLQQSSDELPPPLPPKIVDLDKEMMSLDDT